MKNECSKHIHYIKVTVTLKQSQFTGEANKWVLTINGKDREATTRRVSWFCLDLNDAIHSFNKDEIEDAIIFVGKDECLNNI